MTKLYYTGFNGYNTCPVISNISKIITNWRDFSIENLINFTCGHRVLVIETQANFNIYGTINFKNIYTQVIKKQKRFIAFGCNDECIIACEKNNIHKFSFDLFDWEKLEVSFEKKEEECIWNEEGNEIVKCIFIKNAVIFLIRNGCVWKLVGNRMAIVHLHDVEKAVDICGGFEHCLILTESGCVLSFGGGRGQLGHGDLNSISQPVQISALEGLKVVKISAGGWHSCAITDSGDLCVWGWNNYGQLSSLNQDEEVGISATPEFVDVGPEPDLKVVDVACGTRHTIAKLENGDLLSTGWNAYRQLGIESGDEKVYKFTKCNFSSSKGKVACGPWYTIFIKE